MQTHKRPTVGVLLSGREQFSSYLGGALARWTYEVYSRLSDRIAVTVFGFPTKEEDVYPLPHQTSEAWRVCALTSRIPLVGRYEEYLWLRALIRRLRKLDVVHIHNRPQWVAALRRIGYEGGIVLHLQNDHLGHWSGTMLDALAPELNALVVCSDYLRGTFAPRSEALNAKAHVVFNGANLQVFYPREDLREAKTIFFVGRFDPQKGVIQLLRAFAGVIQTHPDAKLVIGGSTGFGTHKETPYVREVRALARSIIQGGGKIEFPGYIHHDKDLPNWFQRATIFACPSIFQEPFGLVNTEAMASATPVIGANRGGIPEVLGNTGRLVDPENTEEFVAAISALLAHPQDCRNLGQAGYERCRQMFDWRLIAETWMTLLTTVIDNRTK